MLEDHPLAHLYAFPSTLPEPFTIRGWDIERFDPDHVHAMMRKAHAAGMNTISLSHEVVMNAEEILWDWHRYQHLKRFCDGAHALDLRVYLWNHQVNNPPAELIVPAPAGSPRKLKLDSPILWEWLADRYERVIRRVPNFDGIILSLTESEFQIHRPNVAISGMTQAEIMARAINTVHSVLAAHGKSLMVRDFLRTPEEMASFQEAIRHVPPEVMVFTKCVPNDWQYKYPPHPLLGKVSPHKQVMELDLFNETGGNRDLVLPAPAYYRDQLLLARERGLAGAIGRCDDGFRSNVGTPAEFNVYAYSRLLHDPGLDVDSLWREFFIPYYGPKAAPVAIEVLQECFELVCALRYTLGFWTGDHLASIEYTDSRLVNNSSARWSDLPRYREIEAVLTHPDPAAIERVVEEKENARRTALRCMNRLDQARDQFEDPDRFEQLRRYFDRAVRQAEFGSLWVRGYFTLRWYRNTRSSESRQALLRAIQACRSFANKPLDPEKYTHRLPQFAAELEQEVQNLHPSPSPS